MDLKVIPLPTKLISLVGKGITFDSGGLNLKNTKYMSGMYMDKCGGCTVASVFKYAVME